ncbi:MAG: hypothetical protein KF709_04550 [Gemmatimonadaceae bacterium]|nr:hypothetical protein [Gemmatimonadaceae bacterium]
MSSAAEALAAERAGAGRIELCAPGDGGLTATPALIDATLRACSVPVHAMVRPREGDFRYSDAEFARMREEVRAVVAAGAHGVVFGISLGDGRLDAARMGELVSLARPLRVGVHRAFDAAPDPDEALEQCLALGVDVILTAGHAATALEGCETLARLVATAGNRLVVMPGGSVRASNVREIVARTGASEVHARGGDASVIAEIAAAMAAKSP